MPGRKPLPVAIKKLKGTLQKCRMNPHEPRPQGALGEPPQYMPEGAKQAWSYAVQNAPTGLLTSLDATVLERWANCAALYREAVTQIVRDGVSGMVVATPSGILRRSPLMDVVRDLALEMRGYETDMGFTPASRSKVQVRQDPEAASDPWAAIAG